MRQQLFHHNDNRNGYRIASILVAAVCAALVLADARLEAAGQKKTPPPPPVKKPLAPPAPRSSLLTVEDWQKAPLTPLQPGEIDRLVNRELEQAKIQPAALTSDEQFIRRITLDLTGELPVPADVMEFIASRDPRKRAKLIDKLLDSDEYARHWARYWRDVIAARITERRALLLARPFEDWMAQQLKTNQHWDKIARAMIAYEGKARYDEPMNSGAAFFLSGHRGAEGANERAAETSRVFLGIQIQCAQCHDHPSDQWKRVQFHELAGYFARTGERPLRDGKRQVGWELISLKGGEHEMPSKEDPKKGFLTNPRFLDGKTPGQNLGDKERRQALANAVVSPSNYWFAGAFVNRIWGQLMGQSFYQPVDDMGPKKEVVFAAVLTRLTGSFRASHYDTKGLLRDILNSQTYQRQIRLSETSEQHLHFAAAYPTRLRPNALWQSVVTVLGTLGGTPPNRQPPGPFGFRAGFEGLFLEEFDFDPSLKADEVEGSISQALLLMNNPILNNRIQARGTNLLGRILKAYPKNEDALNMVYLRTLARHPTASEQRNCLAYLGQTKERAEAFEDILWALLNSTEFQTKR